MRLVRVAVRTLVVSLAVILVVVVAGGLWVLRGMAENDFQKVRPIDSVKAHQDVRWKDMSRLDLREPAEMIPTLWFNQKSVWPEAARLPAGVDPNALLEAGKNPGLGVRELHRQGITGKGVSVAIIDYRLHRGHPEYKGKIAEFHDLSGQSHGSMHGPAVASLLVGTECGTAPEATLYFVAVPDGEADAAKFAEGLDWIVATNETLASESKIRVVSVSAGPSGPAARPMRNGEKWDQAMERAQAAGLLVLDCTRHHGFLGPCNLDPAHPEDPARCTPVPARGETDFFAGRLLAPVGPRTTAEEYDRGSYGYQYCGLFKETVQFNGTSWTCPYVAGVLALGWQVRPDLSAAQMRRLLVDSAFVRPDGAKIIHPAAFLDRVRAMPAGKD